MTSPFVWLESRCRYTCFILFYVCYMSCVHVCVCVYVLYAYVCMMNMYIPSYVSYLYTWYITTYMDAIYACYGYAYLLPGRHTSQATCGLRRKSIPSTTSVTVSLGQFRWFWLFRASPPEKRSHIPPGGEGKASLKGELIQIPKIISLRA